MTLNFKTPNKPTSAQIAALRFYAQTHGRTWKFYVKIGPDGRMFGPNDDSWLDESPEYKSALNGTHVWKRAWDAGQFKPW